MDELPRTRLTLQRVATHVLARARQQAVGRFGLRASPGGIATPSFGDDHAVVRIAGSRLVVERAKATVASVAIPGSTLRQLADAAGADLAAPLDVGHDTPPIGDPDEPLELDAAATAVIAGWFDLGWRALDEVLGSAASPSIIQLWPEHFDAGCDVAVGSGPDDRCNMGASPGDESHPMPYLYVGPWRADRKGDDSFWNAPFGAVLRREELRDVADPAASAVAFYRRGLALLGE